MQFAWRFIFIQLIIYYAGLPRLLFMYDTIDITQKIFAILKYS